jgi:hypothetical protein
VETSAVVTMVIGMVLIWGGLTASIAKAMLADRRRPEEPVES